MIKKLKILHVHNYHINKGGEDEYIRILKETFEKNGHEVTIYSKNNSEINGYNIFKILNALLFPIFSIKSYYEVVEIIRKSKPDIVHVHNVFPLLTPSVYWAFKKHNIPIVQTFHNFRLYCLNGLFLRNNGMICEECQKRSLLCGVIHRCYRKSLIKSLILFLTIYINHKIKTFKKIDLYIAPSLFVRNKILELGMQECNIIHVPHFTNNKLRNVNLHYKNYAIFIGRLSTEKGILTLIKAFEGILSITLKILGDGPLKDEILEFIKKKKINNIEVLGHIDGHEKEELLYNSKFLIFPSQCYEIFGLSIIESYKCGIPVIASNIGAPKEIVINNVTGLHFKSKDFIDLRNKIEILSNDIPLLNQMRLNAREEAKHKYSDLIGYENISRVYNSLISQ